MPRIQGENGGYDVDTVRRDQGKNDVPKSLVGVVVVCDIDVSILDCSLDANHCEIDCDKRRLDNRDHVVEYTHLQTQPYRL
jgi:hypothetical protein